MVIRQATGLVRHWRQWTEEEARAALEELDGTGESAAGFARRRGIRPQRLAYWKKRLPARARTKFVAVELPPAAPRPAIEIATGGIVVRVREGLDVDHVARLVEAIGRLTGGGC